MKRSAIALLLAVTGLACGVDGGTHTPGGNDAAPPMAADGPGGNPDAPAVTPDVVAAAPADAGAATGGGTEAGAAAPPAVSVDGFFEMFAAAGCAKIFSCCDAAMRTMAFAGLPIPVTDVDSCVRVSRPALAAEALRREGQVRRGVTRFRADLVAACLEAVRAAPCPALQTQYAPAPCNVLFEGTQAGGATCADYDECSSGYCAPPLIGAPVGVACAPAKPCFWDVQPGQPICPVGQFCDTRSGSCSPPIVEGQHCDPYRSGVPCAAGSYCLMSNDPAQRYQYVCRPPGGEGTFCDGGALLREQRLGCLPGLACTRVAQPVGAPIATCVKPGQVGEPCVDNAACGEGLVCRGGRREARTCQPPGAAGSPCDSLSECQTGHHCAHAPGVASGTCTLRAAEDQPCLGNTLICGAICRSLDCADGLFCDVVLDGSGRILGGSKLCKRAGSAGAPCYHHGECSPEAYCTVDRNSQPSSPRDGGSEPSLPPRGACMARMAAGSTCTDRAQCAEGLYCTHRQGQPGQCRPTVPPGMPCDHEQACGSTAFCFSLPGASTGECFASGTRPPLSGAPTRPPTFAWPVGCRPPATRSVDDDD